MHGNLWRCRPSGRTSRHADPADFLTPGLCQGSVNSVGAGGGCVDSARGSATIMPRRRTALGFDPHRSEPLRAHTRAARRLPPSRPADRTTVAYGQPQPRRRETGRCTRHGGSAAEFGRRSSGPTGACRWRPSTRRVRWPAPQPTRRSLCLAAMTRQAGGRTDRQQGERCARVSSLTATATAAARVGGPRWPSSVP